MEELGAFSLTPDVGARVGVGAKSGLPVFNGSPRFALWGKWGKFPLPWPGLGDIGPPTKPCLSSEASEIPSYSEGQ